jgi:hypothetical protein
VRDRTTTGDLIAGINEANVEPISQESGHLSDKACHTRSWLTKDHNQFAAIFKEEIRDNRSHQT